ncbi:MAG: hypothetical protein IJL09_02330, partial [Lachnospiraceae bacterium]|nr:hypothetical protein [Lachnospiraceae bacterium]
MPETDKKSVGNNQKDSAFGAKDTQKVAKPTVAQASSAKDLRPEERIRELEEENKLLFEQLHVVQEELEKRYYAHHLSGHNDAEFTGLSKTILDELATLRRRHHAWRDLMQEVWQLRSQAPASKPLPQDVVTAALTAWAAGGFKAVAVMLLEKGLSARLQADVWRELCQRFKGKAKGEASALECAKRAYALDSDPWKLKLLAQSFAASNGTLQVADALFDLLPEEVNLTKDERKQVTDGLGKLPLPKDLATLSAASDAKGKEVAKIRSDLEAAQKKLAQTDANLQASKKDLAQARTDLEAKNKSLAKTQSDLDASKNALAQAQLELATKSADLTQTKTELDASEEALAQAHADIEKTQTELENKNDALTQAQANLEASKNALAQAQSELATK